MIVDGYLGWSDFKCNQAWPSAEVLESFPSYRRIKLSEIRYKQANDCDQICGLQFIYTGGYQSPMFETSVAREYEHITKTIKIDPSRDIQMFKVKCWNGHAITGIELLDTEGKQIVEVNFTGQG